MNALLASRKEDWKFRSISRQIYSDKHLKRDNVHLSSKALSGIGYILKSKVLYKSYCPELEKEGYSEFIECKRTCKCLFWTNQVYLSPQVVNQAVVKLGKFTLSFYLADVKQRLNFTEFRLGIFLKAF